MTPLILITGYKRTGTTVTRDILSRIGYRDLGEIFHHRLGKNKKRFFYYVAQLAEQRAENVHPHRQLRLLRTFFSEALQASRKPIVYDVKYGAMNMVMDYVPDREPIPSILGIQRELHGRTLHVFRRNTLRRIVSNAIAAKTQEWGISASEQVALPTERKRIRIPPKKITQMIAREQDLVESARALWSGFPGYLEFAYEDMFNADGGVTNKFREALATATDVDLNGAEILAGMKKQNPERLSSLIVNFEEIIDCLCTTPHAWMLECAGPLRDPEL